MLSRVKPTSLRDVSRRAGVSVTTVSRFLNGSLELPVKTRERIENAIKALDYRPNPHARRLSLGRSDVIGMVVPDIANPFFAMLVASVESEAHERGLSVSLNATLNKAGREYLYLDQLSHNHIDGLIFVTNHPDDGQLAQQINRAGRVVVVDEDVPNARAPKLFSDNTKGGWLAGNHLAENGHSHVVFVGGPAGMISAIRRYEGLQSGLRDHWGDRTRTSCLSGSYTIEFGHEAAQHFLQMSDRPTAIFAGSDEIAIGMLEVFRANGIVVPRDVSMIGFDDVGPLHLFASPVTAIRQNVRHMGVRALEVLTETDWQNESGDYAEELLPVEIVTRESVARLPARN